MPSLVRPGSIIPGHEITAGTRTPPSHVDPLAQRNGVNAESGHVSISGPLSDEIDDHRRLELAGALERLDQATADVVELDQRVLVRMLRGRPAEEVGMRVVVEVRAAGAVVEEPRLLGAGHALDERFGVAAPLVVEQRQHRDGDLFDVFHARRRARRARSTC